MSKKISQPKSPFQGKCEPVTAPFAEEQGPTGLIEALSRIDLFERCRKQVLSALIRDSRILHLDDKQVLLHHGSEGSTLYVVLAGTLQVFRSGRVFATVGVGEYVGEQALVESKPRSASVRALGATTVLEIPREAFDTHLRSDPDALAAMMRTVSQRLRNTSEQALAAYETVNMAVHDMLNLLTVFTSVDLVRDSVPPGDKSHVFLDHMDRAWQTMEKMMRAALSEARGSESSYDKEWIRLDQLARECVEGDLSLHPDVKRVSVEVQSETPIAPDSYHRIDLKRVIANLVINAAQALPDGGSIVVKLRQNEGATLLSVTDNGPGIPAELLPLVFEPRFTTKADGNGLGLSSCREIVERRHNGKMTCESTPGRGTTFTCELPRG